MKIIYLLSILFFVSKTSFAQEKYLTKTGEITFFSSAPLEDITAQNKEVLSIIDTNDGSTAIAIAMESFVFPNSLMQEHFNENYVESEKYPKATFKGKIADYTSLKKIENYNTITGELTIHGVTQNVVIPVKVSKQKKSIVLEGKFSVKLADYNIDIPTILFKNIAEEININFILEHQLYNN